ncbi:hypothetical protein [Vibrio diabolicus]|uniref:hypothetical protein n=1 Tax=Vibrio diabolicus TaxID=50719 RepID=UPI002175312B|nr:hypothetical protein [Vibrio diabolicus]
MFRVVYEWRVPSEKMDEFQNILRSTTDSIHQSVDGAFGSFMLRSYDVPEKVLILPSGEHVKTGSGFGELVTQKK